LRRHVLSFFQGNRFLLRDLVAGVVAQIEAESDVVDLYAGAGLFAVSAAVARRARVIAVEGDRAAASDLEANARASGAQIESVFQPVEVFTAKARARPRTVIVDPPRTGMSREALDGAIRLGAEEVVYVSCDIATLARDSRRLLDAGHALRRVDAFDLFPNTPHVETVVTYFRTC
jgi:23S rRNA (uracil1939-C5)-methyltransferase